MSTVSQSREFILPNPTEVYLLVAAGWSGACFALLLAGQRLIRRLVNLSSMSRQLLEGTDLISVLPLVMMLGLIGITVAFYVFSKYPKLFICLILLSFGFADSTWSAIHTVAFLVKYVSVVYIGSFGLFFVYRNWNRINQPVHWLVIIYMLWMAFIVWFYGMRINGIWFVGTQFTLLIAFGVGWMARVNDDKKLMEFNYLVAYTAMVTTCLHMISPIVVSQVFDGGRFTSQFTNATGFATTYVLFVTSLVWLALAHPKKAMRWVGVVFSVLGVGMVFLSGTRNATAALICAIIVLSISFRSKLIWWAIGIGAFVGAIAFLLLAGSDTTQDLTSERLTSFRNNRADVWAVYIESVFERPLFGWGPDGQTGAFYGERAQALAEQFTTRGFAPGVHNSVLGQTVRFGIPGGVLFISMFTYAFWRAKEIVLSDSIPQSYKVAFSLPLVILVTIFLEGAFEDNFNTPRGSVVNVLFGTTVILVVMFADRIKRQVAQDIESGKIRDPSIPIERKKLVRI